MHHPHRALQTPLNDPTQLMFASVLTSLATVDHYPGPRP
ncbi:hypothetical protein BZL30_0742 [Mycobacterium kansasii]|uniref:Uncharacterized protein n=1 Tax=Mycobacterium kansasii TaxID=1768 RepID=A0A1V3XTQ6_MYCKA|nr:hypothetical protein BZL30_0742 [Mycobacterium kansasii]